jgi:hypothetical protein
MALSACTHAWAGAGGGVAVGCGNGDGKGDGEGDGTAVAVRDGAAVAVAAVVGLGLAGRVGDGVGVRDWASAAPGRPSAPSARAPPTRLNRCRKTLRLRLVDPRETVLRAPLTR